jgi:RNA polymerase sigma factor (sigma-70 family)
MTTQSAFIEEYCRSHGRELVGYLSRMLGDDTELAREAAQEAFVALYKTYRGEEVRFPRAMLFKAATNFALMQLRHRRCVRRRMGLPTTMEELEQVPDQALLSHDQHVMADQIGHHLAAAIAALRPTLRSVFVMAHVQGLRRREIAAELGITARRVDKRMTKALKTCREYLVSRGIGVSDFADTGDLVELLGELVAGGVPPLRRPGTSGTQDSASPPRTRSAAR